MPTGLRIALAVVAGFVVMAVLVMVLTVIAVRGLGLHSGHPTPGYLALNVVYSLLAAAAGGWIAGRIARPDSAMAGYWLAGLMVLMAALSYVQYKGLQPVWYQAGMSLFPGAVAILAARSAR